MSALRWLYPAGVATGAGVLLAAGGFVPVVEAWMHDRLGGWADVVRLLGGVTLPGAPRDLDSDFGPSLTQRDASELVRVVADLCRRVGARPPGQIRLTYLPCCGVVSTVSRGRSPGRTLIVGLPLFHVLDAEEMTAVLAHEVAHLAHGDEISAERSTRFLNALEQEMERAEGTAKGPLIAWARVCHAAGRRLAGPLAMGREVRADRFAASLVGGAATASALVKVALVQPLFREVLMHYEDRGQALNGPDLYAFFRQFWDRLPEATVTALRHRILTRPAVSDGLHPSLLDRLSVLKSHPMPSGPVASRSIPARAWLGDLEHWEQLMHNRLFGLSLVERTVFHRAGS